MPLKAILNSFIAGLVSCILAIGFKYIGIYLVLLSYFSSLPFFIICFYYGFTGLLFSGLISVFIMSYITSFYVGIMFCFINILPVSIILLNKTKNKFNYLNFISKLTLANSIIFITFSFIYKDEIKIITKDLTEYFSQNLKSNITIDQSLLDLAPSILIFSWSIILILNLIISRVIITKYFKNFVNFSDKIINLQLQKWLIALFIFFLIPASILSHENGTWFRSLALIYAIPITIQGLCTLHTLFKKKKMGNVLIYTFYSIIFIIPLTLPLITAIGVLEHIYNFRDIENKNKVN
jgi:hypothetical protein